MGAIICAAGRGKETLSNIPKTFLNLWIILELYIPDILIGHGIGLINIWIIIYISCLGILTGCGDGETFVGFEESAIWVGNVSVFVPYFSMNIGKHGEVFLHSFRFNYGNFP